MDFTTEIALLLPFYSAKFMVKLAKMLIEITGSLFEQWSLAFFQQSGHLMEEHTLLLIG